MKKVIALLLTFLLILICAVAFNEFQNSSTEFVLNTVSTIKVKGSKSAVKMAFERVREIEEHMSSHLSDSDIVTGRLNSDTIYVIKKGIQYGDLSEGTFDISVKPLCDLWDINGENPKVPSEEQIQQTLKLVDYKKIKIENDVLILPDGMAIDLGAIAKGYAADEACRVLREQGITDGIVDLGGNIVALGTKKIGIRNPDSENNGDYFGTVTITDCAVATSGGYERYFEHNGVRYHHIFDPNTGYPVKTDLLSATVVADNAIDADCWSTILFSAGLEGAEEYIAKYKLKAVLTDQDGNIHTYGDIVKD